ncbi:MAG: translocation/assembly module TamB domain-containing protein, partial [Bacteroidales bacterium]|nr:translocation/assembly module TamB domain-containing protein [Bacteroidales bacterium]
MTSVMGLKNKIIKKNIKRILLFVLLGLILLPVILLAVLQIGAVQTMLARKGARYLSEKLNTEICVDKATLTGFRDLKVSGLRIMDLQNDTLLYASDVQVSLGYFNSRMHYLKLNRVILDSAYFVVKRNASDSSVNLNLLIEKLKSTDTVSQDGGWIVHCSFAYLNNCRFKYLDEPGIKEAPNEQQVNFHDLYLDRINAKISDVKLLSDSILLNIRSISFNDHSGFALKKFAGHLAFSSSKLSSYHTSIETERSTIMFDLDFTYPDHSAFNDFMRQVSINSTIKPSKICLGDVAFFVPTMIGMNNNIDISGKLRGTISNLKTKDFYLKYGQHTTFFGNISMNGLPDIQETFIHFNIPEFITHVDDIKQFIFPGIEKNILYFPAQFESLGSIRVSGQFTGFINDFVSYGSFNTNLGNLNTDLELKKNIEGQIEYKGKINVSKAEIGLLSGLDDFGLMNASAELHGKGISFEVADIQLNGAINSLEFNDYTFEEITLSGHLFEQTFNGLITVNDEMIYLDFGGLIDLKTSLPRFDFQADIQHANLYELSISERDSTATLSTHMSINVTGDDIDNLNGFIKLDSTVYVERQQEYFLDTLWIVSEVDSSGHRDITINSDFVDSHIEGHFRFDDMQSTLQEILNNYLLLSFPLSVEEEDTEESNFTFRADLKNTKSMCDLFLPSLKLAKDTYVYGNVNSRLQDFNLNANSSLIEYSGLKFEDWSLISGTINDEFILNTTAKHMWFIDKKGAQPIKLGLDQLALKIHIDNDSLIYNFEWDDVGLEDSDIGALKGFVAMNKFPEITAAITHATMVFNDTLWIVQPGNLFVFDTTSYSFRDFNVFSEGSGFSLEGTISENPDDVLDVSLTNLDISNADLILDKKGLDIDGIINGHLSLKEMYHSPNVISDLTIKNFFFNKEDLGEATIRTTWDNEQVQWDLFAEIVSVGNDKAYKSLDLTGYYSPKNKDDQLRLNAALDNFRITLLSPFFTGFMDNLTGYASGDLALTGNTSGTSLTGAIKARRGEFRIKFLNTTYSFSDQILFTENAIVFDSLVVFDQVGNKALVDGQIQHVFFKDIIIDLHIATNSLTALNTGRNDNDYFYGTAVATGVVNISGPAENITLDVIARTEKGTMINIPINYTADVSDNYYIRFVNREESNLTASKSTTGVLGPSMNFEFDVTPEADIKLYLPMQMGDIEANGGGLLKMMINPEGEVEMFGTYLIEKGSFFFSLQNMIRRTFRLRQGGTISWTGDLFDARVNLKGVYSVRAPLSSIPLSITDSSLYNQRILVDCVIGLSGNIYNPDINFTIELPNVTSEVRELVYSAIDTTNEVLMNEQMISLLVLNSFS